MVIYPLCLLILLWWRKQSLSVMPPFPLTLQYWAFSAITLKTFKKIKSQPFFLPQSNESLTYCELVAVHAAWIDISICKKFKSLVIKHFTDNKGVVAILGKGSKHPKLQKLVREIFLSLRLYEIVMVPAWISREHEVIQYADRGSKDFRYDDFGLTQDSNKIFPL